MKTRLLTALILAVGFVSSCSSTPPEPDSSPVSGVEEPSSADVVEPEEVYTVEAEEANSGDIVASLPREPSKGESYVELPGDLYVKVQEGEELPARAKTEVDRRVSRAVAQAKPETITDEIADTLHDVPDSYVVITVTPSVIYGVDPDDKKDGYAVCAVASTSLYSCFYGHDKEELHDLVMSDSSFPDGDPTVKVVDLTS